MDILISMQLEDKEDQMMIYFLLTVFFTHPYFHLPVLIQSLQK
jgi:hypothetical protein